MVIVLGRGVLLAYNQVNIWKERRRVAGSYFGKAPKAPGS